MATVTIGVCEDDHALRSVLSRAFVAAGYEVIPVATASEARRAFLARPPGVIVMDLGLPDADGRDLVLALQAAGVTAPVLMLTALSDLHHRISGFEAGADDYLAKPFDLAELLARVRVLARRARGAAAAEPAGGLILDPERHTLRGDEAEVSLSPTEFRLLARLMSVPGDAVRRSALIAAAWPPGAIVSENTLDSYIRRIRAKLAELDVSGPTVETVRGVGYAWR